MTTSRVQAMLDGAKKSLDDAQAGIVVLDILQSLADNDFVVVPNCAVDRLALGLWAGRWKADANEGLRD